MSKPDTTKLIELGKYLALTTCTECHGANLEGQQLGEKFTPNLRITALYSRKEFSNLMESGIGKDGSEKMKWIAESRFSHFTEQELTAIHAYLNTM